MATETSSRIFDPETHIALANFNQISFNEKIVPVATNNDFSGWYYAPDATSSFMFIQDNVMTLTVTIYSTPYNCKPHALDRKTPALVLTLRKGRIAAVDLDVYQETTTGFLYIYNSQLQEFQAYQEDVNTLFIQGNFTTIPTTMTRWNATDDRLWSYQFKLADPSAIFNSFQKFFKFTYNFYKAGRLSSFTFGGPSAPLLNINPYNLDYSQIKRSLGAKSRYEYDSIYQRLRTTGILRKYQINQITYWPTPGTATGLSPTEQQAIQGEINQQRDQFLAIYPFVPNQGLDNAPLLCPGNRVQLRNTGTRLDDVPLKLAMLGYHSNPKPPIEFTNPSFYNNWSYYSIRLPLVVTPANNRIYYRLPGQGTDSLIELPLGQFNVPELFDYLNDTYPFIYAFFFIPDFIVGQDNTPYLIFTSLPGSIWNSPNHPVNPSTFFGPDGVDLGDFFPTDTLVAGPDGVVFSMVNDRLGLKVHTPLTTEEVQSLLANLSVITVESLHGPVTNEMDYDNFVACILELSTAMTTEVHTLVNPWVRMGDSFTTYLYTDRKTLFRDLNSAILDYSKLYTPARSGTVPGLYQRPITMPSGLGGPLSENYKPGPYRNMDTVPNAGTNRLNWLWPQAVRYYPQGTTVNYLGVPYDLSGRETDIITVNYLEDAVWLQTEQDAQGNPLITFLPYAYYETIYSTNPGRLTGEKLVVNGITYRVNAAAFGPTIDLSSLTGELIVADPILANVPLINAADVNGKIAIVQAGPVDFGIQVLNCQNAGAIAVIVINNQPNGVITMRSSIPGITIPSFMISQADGAALLAMLVPGLEGTLYGSFIIAGEYMIGFYKESKVREYLGILDPLVNVPRIGYITFSDSASSLLGNAAGQKWYELNAGVMRLGGTFIAAKIIEYFNLFACQHLYFDITNNNGGTSEIIAGVVEHMGQDRFVRYSDRSFTGGLTPQQTFDEIGYQVHKGLATLHRNSENQGIYEYTYTVNARNAQPQTIIAQNIFLPQEVFFGPAPASGANPNLNLKRNVLWVTNETTTSATQFAYLQMKSSSLTRSYDGDFGQNVQFIGYGVYDRFFSTGGFNGSLSYLNWYAKGRTGQEELKISPMSTIDRSEGIRIEFIDADTPTSGGEMHTGDDQFGRLQQPNIQWDLRATNFFQGIGYTLDAGVDVSLYGQPWVPKRYNDVVFTNQLTWRNPIAERGIQMLADPNVEDNFFVLNGYGFLN